jgi:arylsulfatase A-like enzyme
METIDDEVIAKTDSFLERQAKAGTPFFVWFNTSHMHFRTHAKPQIRGNAGRWQSEYRDVMVEHDQLVGRLLQKVDELGITDNTIVMYSTDNGPHMNSWPDAGMTPFRNEKDSAGPVAIPQTLQPAHRPLRTRR